jgi:hypothetical protein
MLNSNCKNIESLYASLTNALLLYNTLDASSAFATYHKIDQSVSAKYSDIISNYANKEYSALSNITNQCNSIFRDNDFSKLKKHLEYFNTYSNDLYNKFMLDVNYSEDKQYYDELEKKYHNLVSNLNLSDDEYVSYFHASWGIDKSLIGSNIQKTINNAAISEKYELTKLQYGYESIVEQLDTITYDEAYMLLDELIDNYHKNSTLIYKSLKSNIDDYVENTNIKQSQAKKFLLNLLDYDYTSTTPPNDSNIHKISNEYIKTIQDFKLELDEHIDNIKQLSQIESPMVDNISLKSIITQMIKLNNTDAPQYTNIELYDYLKQFKTVSLKMRRSLHFPDAIMEIVNDSDIIIVPDANKLIRYSNASCSVICIEDINTIIDDHNISNIFIDYASSFFENEMTMIYKKFGKSHSQSFIKIG